ncbi:MAG TPA: PAS domain-containing protein [Burkholderiales bacterium]|nr:PAS domain-containing protein [Burkholderiales bacterium]
MILARQLASSIAIPILLIDAEGALVFYNEPAEALLSMRFEETGEITADELLEAIAVEDENRKAIRSEERPTRIARRERRPVTRRVWIKSGGGEWRHVQATAVPLVGERETLLGVMHFLWEI